MLKSIFIILTQLTQMQEQKKYTQSRRSQKDKSIFDVYYLISNSNYLPTFISQVGLDQYIKIGQVLGYVKQGQDVINTIQATFNGTVVAILAIQAKNIKNNKAHIFSIKLCEHYPKDKQQYPKQPQSFPSTTLNPTSNSYINNPLILTADICMYCQQKLWYYFQKTQKSITFAQFVRNFDNFDLQDFQWKLVLNEQFTKKTQIGGTYQQNYCIPSTGKITYLYQFNNKKPTPDTIVIKYKNIVCKHQKIVSNLCLFCYQDIHNVKNANLTRYLFQLDVENYNSKFVLSGQAIQDLALEYKNSLIRNKKLLLVLDLDNTILHSIARKKVDDEMLRQMEDYVIIPPQQAQASIFIERTLVKLRPGFQYFLSKIIKYYQIYIYTKGTRPYAQQICSAIRKKYAHILNGTKNFLRSRLISRDQDPDIQKKNLQFIIPKNRDIILILDDRRDVWQNSQLCIITKPYTFFYHMEITQDGKTKLAPVQWQKGGGTLQHKFNQKQEQCIKEIEQAEILGDQHLKQQKIKQLQKQIENQMKQNQEIIVVIPENMEQNLQSKTNQKRNIQWNRRSNISTNINTNSNPLYNKKQQLQKYILKNTSDIPDQFLITTLFGLKQAYTLFFQKIKLKDDKTKLQGKYTDLCNCFNQYKKYLLEHVTAFFIGQDYKKSNIYRRAQRLGLKITQNMYQKCDIVIRPNSFSTQNSQQFPSNTYYYNSLKKLKILSQIKKIPIISQSWIDACYQFNCCVHYEYFQVNNPYDKNIFVNQGELSKAIGQATMNTAVKIEQVFKQIQSYRGQDRQIV